jgi:hypothetical protein
MQMSGARCSYGRGRVTEGGIEGDVHPKASMVCSQKHFVKREVTSGLNSKAGRHPNTIYWDIPRISLESRGCGIAMLS